MEYDFELREAVRRIHEEKARLVCIQMPDGLKPRAIEIAGQLEQQSGAEVVIWMDSCFGACDIPLELKNLKVELLIQFGHSPWPFWEKRVMEL